MNVTVTNMIEKSPNMMIEKVANMPWFKRLQSVSLPSSGDSYNWTKKGR